MKKSRVKTFISLFIATLLLSSCLPEQEIRIPPAGENFEQTGSDDTTGASDKVLTLPQTTNFLQLGSLQTTTTLSLFSDYSDRFLLRGNNMIDFLEKRPNSSENFFCLVSHFPGSSGANAKNVLVLSARIHSFYNKDLARKEYRLQMGPNKEANNQGDCLTIGMTSKIQSLYKTSDIAFKLKDVCPSCNVNINSTGLRIFSSIGVEVTQADISFLFLKVMPQVGLSVDSSPSCSINSNCTSLNFNCCLSGQCVNHGQAKSNVDTSSDKFSIATQLISVRPELIVNYEDIFYICPLMVPTTPSNNQDPEIDPVQQANNLFTELQSLHNCTTPSIDEFGICQKDYANASLLMSASPFSFSSEVDDINFSSIVSLSGNNIVQVDYAGINLYKEQLLSSEAPTAIDSSVFLGSANDNLTTAQSVSIQKSLPPNAINDKLSILYKVDSTCEKLGSSLARCQKFYTQGQSSTPVRSSDHVSGNQSFLLPSYVDNSLNVIVEVSGNPTPQGADTWLLSGNTVTFNSTLFPILDNQQITITYFVTSNVSSLTFSKELAQTKIDKHCKCDPLKKACSLKPQTTKLNGIIKTTSFICVYPEPDVPPPPLQQTVFVSAKSVPHKFYDSSGVNHDLGDIPSTLPQEGSLFEYTDGNFLKPNNITQDIGFNEIYGSMNVNSASSTSPKVINLTKGKSYDLFVDQGAFSTCLNCGTDYFSSFQKVFPNNFKYKGGGYLPDTVESRRSTNVGDYRADDLRFGRACFVPATMLPWTHVKNTDIPTQRRNRLSAQHFLFANGYNKDWYGFDYGSLIGSFDGVKWFAVGNQRRIKADSTKLYLAVNAYFGDLTNHNSFSVTINELNAAANSGSLIDHDSDNDGAQCQRSHFCKKDEDCIAQLGYDYTCMNVSSLQTPWPLFDTKGNEIAGSATKSLLSLVGGSNGEVKRCVYRGVGSICEKNNFNVSLSTSYTNSTTPALHTCSNNSVCTDLITPNFNTKISRYAMGAVLQNIQSFITNKTDTFGLATRDLGRPYDYYGSTIAPLDIRSQFNSNKVQSLCVPGKDVANINTLEEANGVNFSTREADKITNIGRTIASTILQDENYLAACPSTNEDGNYTHLQDLSLNDPSHKPFAISQNMSTNSLILNKLAPLNLFNDTASLVTQKGYHKNSCLRVPGAKCFSDFECSPNSFISKKFKSISDFELEISAAEEAFWEEELICGNSQERYLSNSIFPNPVYETFEHRCCRETDKSFTYFSQPHEGASFSVVNASSEPLIPGVNQDINDPLRYSRTHTVYDKLITEPSNYPSLVSPAPQPVSPLPVTSITAKQYNTLHLNNKRMCCTGHWVRSFSSGTNANTGGHKFSPLSQQNIPLSTFKPLSWNKNNVPALNIFSQTHNPESFTNLFSCQVFNAQTSDCEIKNIIEGSSEERKYLNWFSKFELIGIPQVLIETNNTVEKPLSTEAMDLDGDTFFETAAQQDISAAKLPLENTIKDVNAVVNPGVIDATFGGTNYYSAASYDNFEIAPTQLKKIFSESEFNCCIPTGFEVPNETKDSACCTGFVGAPNAGSARCCLQDFTDLTVYTNRYVSSEGAFFNGQPVSDSDIDPTTGYVKKEIVSKMASTMCCSGSATTGKVIGDYFIPIEFTKKHSQSLSTRRYAYIKTLDNDADVDVSNGGVSKYNAGLKWNTHVYCVPQDFESGDGGSGGSGAVANP